MPNSTATSRADQLIAILEAEVASTEMDVSEFDLNGAADALLETERSLGRELDSNTDGLLIASTLEAYWAGE